MSKFMRDNYMEALPVYAWRQTDESWSFYLADPKSGGPEQHIGNLLIGRTMVLAVCESLSKPGALRSFYTRLHKMPRESDS